MNDSFSGYDMGAKRMFWVLIGLLILSATVAPADQWTCLSEDIASRAERLIQQNTEVREYCAPCGDKHVRRVIGVSKIVRRLSSGSCGLTLIADGIAIDLAYLYVLADGRWQNAAMKLNLDVIHVPRYLPSKQPLSLVQIESLIVDVKAPDALIAGEIKDRGLSFRVSAQHIQELKQKGMGPLTMRAFENLQQ